LAGARVEQLLIDVGDSGGTSLTVVPNWLPQPGALAPAGAQAELRDAKIRKNPKMNLRAQIFLSSLLTPA
jgi:hypothetical protein